MSDGTDAEWIATTQELHAALGFLRASTGVDPDGLASADPAFLLGRLTAVVEIQTMRHGAEAHLGGLEAGYQSAIIGPYRVTQDAGVGTYLRVAVKRLALTVRQLRMVGGLGGRAARLAMSAAAMALFTEVVLADDDTALEELTEPVEDACELLEIALGQMAEMSSALAESRGAA